mmetsp:Transcript_49934/g.82173  ORF Transcript_49934/g.82173 Transcript_49934/m.82173 type:complete len:458 (-) Transcript_49934:7-1380(-)
MGKLNGSKIKNSDELFRTTSGLGILSSHVLDQVHHTGGVAPLVVIPAHNLHEGRIQHDAGLGIEGAGDWAGLEVSGHQGLIGVAKEALHVTLRSLLHLSANLLVGGLLLQLNGEVHDRHIDGWHAQGHAGQLALHFRDHLCHSLGSTRGGWDDVSRASTATTPVLLGGAVHSGLRGSHGMAGGHETTLDAPLLLQHSHSWGQAVGGAGGARHALHGWLVGVLVHTHHNGVGVILGRSREDHFLCASLQVTLNLLSGQEHTCGFANILCTMLTKRDLSWVTGVGQSNLLAINHQGVAICLHGSIILAVDSVIFHHVGQVVRVIAGVDQLQLSLWVLHGNAGHLTANAAEAVDSNTHSLHGSAVLACTPASNTSHSQASHCTHTSHGTHGLGRGGLGIAGRTETSPGLLCNWATCNKGAAQGSGGHGTADEHSHVLHSGRHGFESTKKREEFPKTEPST